MLILNHQRKGRICVIASEDFDTEEETFYPVQVALGIVKGLNTEWEAGEDIPCRKTLCKIVRIGKSTSI